MKYPEHNKPNTHITKTSMKTTQPITRQTFAVKMGEALYGKVMRPFVRVPLSQVIGNQNPSRDETRDRSNIPKSWTTEQLVADPYLPDQYKARLLGLVENASEGNTGLISWGDVARVGMNAGLGYMGASLIGKTVGGLFGGLTPATTKRLQDAGIVAGLLKGTVNLAHDKSLI